jgi:hypothetical protein
MLVKGLSILAERPFLSFANSRPSQTKFTMLFVEKFGSYENLDLAMHMVISGKPLLTHDSSASSDNGASSYNIRFGIYPSISTDMANEFIAQRNVVNKIEPRVIEIKESDSTT